MKFGGETDAIFLNLVVINSHLVSDEGGYPRGEVLGNQPYISKIAIVFVYDPRYSLLWSF